MTEYLNGRPILGDILVTDNTLLKLGHDSDGVLLLRSTALAADTALTSVLVGTVESQGIAANSVMIANATSNGDIALYTNKGGNSQMGIWLDGSTGDTALLVASGASIDHYIAGAKVLDHAAGAFAFQENTTISSTGSLTITTPIIASFYQASGGGLLSVPASAGADTVVLLAATQEMTNKTLNAAVAKGTWTASGTWTIPAVTLGGQLSGGSNTLSDIGPTWPATHKGREIELQAGWTSATQGGGSGSTSQSPSCLSVNSGSTAASQARLSCDPVLATGIAQTANGGWIAWGSNHDAIVSLQVYFSTAGTSKRVWVKFANAVEYGDPTGKAIGLRFDGRAGDTQADVKGIVHDGTSLTVVDLATLQDSNTVKTYRISSRNGTVTWYVDGVSKGSSAAGPTGSASGNKCVIDVDNGTDAAQARITVLRLIDG